MKFYIIKIFSLLSFACLLSMSPIQANRYADDEECCRSASSYECGCNPLHCGAWDTQVQGGVAPIVWTKRDGWVAVNPSNTPPLVDLIEGPQFSKLFKLPWIVGGQLGYAWSDNTRVYVEFDYLQVNRKHDVALVVLNNQASSFVINARKYKLFEGYAGVRYYWDRWCDHISFFFGGKVGFTHHQKSSFDFIVGLTPPTIVTFSDVSLFTSNTVVSGGANFGFDACFCGNWSFVLTGEVVASCGPDGNRNIVINNVNFTMKDIIVGHVRTELRFPVTAGFRYSF